MIAARACRRSEGLVTRPCNSPYPAAGVLRLFTPSPRQGRVVLPPAEQAD